MVMMERMMENKKGSGEAGRGQSKSRWPVIIIGSLAVVFFVNAFMLYMSLKTDDGLVNEDYYVKGLFYDEGLKGEKELGWEIGLSFTAPPSQTAPASVRVEISRDGEAVKGASVAIVLKRPATDRYDRAFALSPSGGAYAAEIEVPLGGLWDIEVSAGEGGKTMTKTFRVRV